MNQPPSSGYYQATDGRWYPIQPPPATKRTAGDIIFRIIALAVALAITGAIMFAVLWDAAGH